MRANIEAYFLSWISNFSKNQIVGLVALGEELKHLIIPRCHRSGEEEGTFRVGECRRDW